MKTEAWIVTLIAVFIFLQGYLTSDEAFKYVNPYILFWIKAVVGSLAAGGMALKAFMSTSFSDSKQKNGNGKIVLQVPTPDNTAQPTNQPMKTKLSIIIAFAMLCLSSNAGNGVWTKEKSLSYGYNLTNVVWLKPHMFYHNPVTGWGFLDAAPTPLDDEERYYWDGEGDGTFSPNDTLITITYYGTNRYYQIGSGPYEINHPVMRNPDGTFPQFYLGVLWYGGPYQYP